MTNYLRAGFGESRSGGGRGEAEADALGVRAIRDYSAGASEGVNGWQGQREPLRGGGSPRETWRIPTALEGVFVLVGLYPPCVRLSDADL
jgi:hypothetical protein